MQNLYMMLKNNVDSTVAMAVTRFYMDYYKKDLRPVHITDREDLPWHEVSAEARIFIIGFTPPYEVFQRLIISSGDIIWIDNDEENVQLMYGKSTPEINFKKIKGKRLGDQSLCELTWDSYFAWMRNQPEIIKLVGRYTMGDREHPEWDSRIVPFNVGLQTREIDPFDEIVFEEFWKKIICLRRDPDFEREMINQIIAKGKGEE